MTTRAAPIASTPKPGVRKRWRRLAAVGAVVVVVAAGITVFVQVRASGIQTQLDYLVSLDPEQAAAYLDAHPGMIAEIANANGSITGWWASATSAERDDLVTTTPAIAGALNGVPYVVRDQANRVVLQNLIDRETRELKTDPDNGSSRQTLAALKALNTAIQDGFDPQRYLVTLVDDELPLAAVAVGNLDTADQVTYSVPGMGTYTNDMSLWAQSAENLATSQISVGAPSTTAVVAWINYRTPPPGIDAALGAYADRGAPRLAADIAGLLATRKGDPVDTVNVVGFSYGTTTAANALADLDLGLYSFVMLGSAGIDPRITNASSLHAEGVYAAEAATDQLARWGRLSRTDPRAPDFGATVFQVDGDPDRALLAVTGHEFAMHSQWNDDPNSSAWKQYRDADGVVDQAAFLHHFESWGYLDNRTESLLNTAIATTRNPTASMSVVGR